MITASKTLKTYIDAQESKPGLAKKLDISRQALYQIKGGSNISATTVAKILEVTGFDFEQAFEVKK